MLAIDRLMLNEKTTTFAQIGEWLNPPLSAEETRHICRSLLSKGFVSFINPGKSKSNVLTYVELTSIGDIQVKQIREA